MTWGLVLDVDLEGLDHLDAEQVIGAFTDRFVSVPAPTGANRYRAEMYVRKAEVVKEPTDGDE